MRRWLGLLSSLIAWPACAGEAHVAAVRLGPEGDDRFTVYVTVQHADTGWQHYSDLWQVMAPDGTVLAERQLLHPHVDEQPFTRSLRGVTIPAGIERITVRAHDTQHGFGGETITAEVPR